MPAATEVLIGAPTRKRQWILPRWREHVLAAAKVAGVKPRFVFVIGEDDHLGFEWPDTESVVVEEPPRDDIRRWNPDRYEHMVFLRNTLLGRVREIQPQLFLSLDTDILLHPNAIDGMLEVLTRHPEAWACGGKAFLSERTEHFPTYGMWQNKSNHGMGFRRQRSSSVMQVDVLMAVKMMRPLAYSTDYVYHRHGEDVGWSSAIAKAGGVLWWDGRFPSKHVMRPDLLDEVDRRCGY